MLMMLYNPGSREGLIRELAGMKVQLAPEEKRLSRLTDKVIKKLNAMDDATFIFNLATNLSGYVIGPAMLLILGFDIWFLIHTAWQHVLILSLLEGCCLAVLFGQAVVLEFLDNIRDGLFQFVRS